MFILSHRGFWRTIEEKNSSTAFDRSFGSGFGTETDIRDCLGNVVISHDPPTKDAIPVKTLFESYERAGRELPLALNVKSDGLCQPFLAAVKTFINIDYFVFDMAVPDALGWLKAGVPTFTRHSDIEKEPPFYSSAAGVWLDAFYDDWWNVDSIKRHLDAGKRVCVVSPELHGRNYLPAWERLNDPAITMDPRVMLCTDYPQAATEVLLG